MALTNFFNPAARGGINPTQAFAQGQAIGQSGVEQNLIQQIQQNQQQGFGGILGGESRQAQLASGNQQALNELRLLNPTKAKVFDDISEEREQALFQDARTVNTFLKANQPEQALNFLSARLADVERLGGDSRDTAEIAGLIAQGNIPGAIELLDLTDQLAVQQGVLNAPATQPTQEFKNIETLQSGERIGVVGGVERVIPSSPEVKQARKDALKLKSETATFLKEEQKLKLLNEKAKLAKSNVSKRKIDQEITKRQSETLQNQKNVKFEFDSAIGNIDDSISTIGRMLEGEILESATGFQANFPTLSGTKASDFEAMLDTLQSQTFLSQVEKMKGLGALSEAEGRKLAQAIGSLTIDQSDKTFRTELARIKETFDTAKTRLTAKFKNKFITEPNDFSKLSLEELKAERARQIAGGS